MATRKPDTVKYSSPDGGQTKYIENQDLPARLKTAYDKKQNFTMPTAKQTGSGDRKAQVAKRQAKTKTYLERKRGSTPTKRTTTAGNATQPVRQVRNTTPTSDYLRSAPLAQTFAQNAPMQGDPRNVRGVNPGPMQGDPRNLRGVNPGTPQNRPSAFGQQPQMQQPYQQPNSAMTMGIQPMGNQNPLYQTYLPFAAQPYQGQPPQPMQPRPSAFGQPNSAMTMGIQPMGNPYMNSQNPSQMMSGYQPPMGNPNPWGRRW